MQNRIFRPLSRNDHLHALRTAIAATTSLLIARLFHMPEAYWAPISTIIIVQSTVKDTWDKSLQRLVGTAFGVTIGAALTTLIGSNAAVFALGVFLVGIVCFLLRFDTAHRLGGVAVAIVMLVARYGDAWTIARHRFLEVSIGIAVGLIFAVVWPESQPRPEQAG
jgi:uncharacterized membrane protein YgaE (UPF0421/DUF939 family)